MDNAQKQPADAVGSSEGLGLAPERDEATRAYSDGRGDQYEDDCEQLRLLFENLDDADVYTGGFINTTRVRELLTHFDLPRSVECSGLGCTRPECDSMGCTADRIETARDERIESVAATPRPNAKLSGPNGPQEKQR